MFVRPQDLEAHIARLRRWGYRLVTFGELADRVADGGGAGHAALTFDDGLQDNLTTLEPILRRTGAPATVFAVSGWLGGAHPDAPWARILSADELRRLHEAGLEIGAHSHSHADLTQLPAEQARDELATSRAVLEEILDAPVKIAAYPRGAATEETIAAARAAGFGAACRTAGLGSWSDPWNLPRQAMINQCSSLGLWLKRRDHYEPLMRFRAVRFTRSVIRRGRASLT